MPPLLTAQLKRLGASVNAMTLGQKVIAVIGIAVLALGGTAFVKWTTKPTYAPLYSSLAASDASSITAILTKDGVPYTLSDGGATIMVPQKDVDAERLKAAAAGLPASDSTGYALLDKSSITSSQFQQTVTYQRALEGELDKTIEGISGVQSAVVHLAIPQETVFTDKAGKSTASVLVATQAGVTLSDDQVTAIVHLVSSSVPSMSADQVTVSDSKGHLLSAAGQGITDTGSSNAASTAYDQSTASAVQAMLDKVLGTGNAIASVNATLNYDKTQKTSQTFSQTQGTAPLSTSKTNETYTGSAASSAGGTLGLDTATGTTAGGSTTTTGTGTGSGYTKTSETSDNAINKDTTQTVVAPGGVTVQSVAVVVDSAAVAKAGLPQLTQMVSAAAGIDTARGDTLSVTQATFDKSATKAAAAQLAQEKTAVAAQAKMKLIKQGITAAAILLAAIFLFILYKRASKRVVREPVDLGALERMYPGTGPVINPDALALEALRPPAPDPAALRRTQVGELVDQQPGDVADLLRGWLTETKKV